MEDLTDEFKYMATSLFIAFKALLMNETPVACILVNKSTGKIISIGYNYTNASLNGTKHAEFIAVKRLMENDHQINFQDIIMYVTVEPCIMCASFLRQLGINQVIYGCSNDRFGGNGTVLSIHNDKKLIGNTYKSIGGIMRTEAIQLLRNFYIQENESAPVPKVKKNKDIENKLYPPNIFNVNELEFTDYYGLIRKEEIYNQSDKEITPIIGHGYKVSNLVNLQYLKDIPYLEQDMGVVDDEQVNEFFDLFYDIDDNGQVQFSSKIRTYNSKKRHLNDDE
ncbi:cytidine deaminase-like protein [Scheffersomyces amazonensis]|uniref:cytidine deaminase-like protein n=1 Tax=Scheffersomyces amazonensis TaxID=1078765 RepID=UPI00315CCC08